jgi:ubiquinone/menaquinone biosynthesis C-methylase UbiE
MSSGAVAQDGSERHGYTMGHSEATTKTHEARTVQTDASFVIPHIKAHHHILDVGCGPGTITVGFVPLAAEGKVVGVDYSHEVIERAISLSKSTGAGQKVTFVQGNLLDGLAFEDESFDIVFASQVFGHLQPRENAVQALVECRRVLKPNGILAVRDAAFMSWYPYTAELDRIFTKNLWKSIGGEHFGGFTMRAWLRDAGFDVENEAKVKIGGGSDVYANRVQCQWRCDSLVGRLAKGQKFRESWLKAGISEEECDEAVRLLKKWAESDDAFYGILQTEVLAEK